MNNKKLLEIQLEEINQILSEKYIENKQLGALTGIYGIALFKFYYSKYKKVDTHAEVGLEILSEGINRINEGYSYPTYCVGIAGAGWAMEHLVEEGLLENDNDELLEGLDEYLFENMISDIKNGNFDFLHGAIGYGFYFLKRYKNTKITSLKNRYKKSIGELIYHLSSMAIIDGSKLKWQSILDHKKQNMGYNLSLSHGIPSIANFLARVLQLQMFNDKASLLLHGAVDYILSLKQLNLETLSLFPNKIEKDKFIEYNSRVAWCYGDLGVGITLWQAGKVLKNKALEKEAEAIMEHASKRKDPESSLVIDAAVCHGSYGNAQIFHRMYKNTNNPIFKETAAYWIEDGLSKAIFKDGYAGYKQWNGEVKEWKSNATLLEGVSGIGLTIIDHLADFKINWDECLMIS